MTKTDKEWLDFCRPFVYMNGSHEMPNYAAICRAVVALCQPPAAPAITDAQIEAAFLSTIAAHPGELSVTQLPTLKVFARACLASPAPGVERCPYIRSGDGGSSYCALAASPVDGKGDQG